MNWQGIFGQESQLALPPEENVEGKQEEQELVVVLEFVPGPQYLQVVIACEGATNPVAQGVQERDPPTDDLPIGHTSQMLSDDEVHSVLMYFPTPQVRQEVHLTAFSELNLLLSQAEQSDFPPIE